MVKALARPLGPIQLNLMNPIIHGETIYFVISEKLTVIQFHTETYSNV